MNKEYKNVYSPFISMLAKLIFFIAIIIFQTASVVSEDIKADRTLHIIMNIFIWILIISIINKTYIKYYLVGTEQSQFTINNRLDEGKLAKLLVLASIMLNGIFFLTPIHRALIAALELIFLAAADAIIEVKIRIFMDN